eukprot:15472660-Heterocapsa_arctica.AAC.1
MKIVWGEFLQGVRMGPISGQGMALSSRALRGARSRRVLGRPPEGARHGEVQASNDTGRGEEQRGGRERST